MSWTIAEARSVPCPKCKAGPGDPCTYRGKGSEKAMREGRSHQQRIDVMVIARRGKPRGRRIEKPQEKVPSTPITIFTDGACIGNPGPGGWAAIIHDRRTSAPASELTGLEVETTNNRMEMAAVIAGLESLPSGQSVTIFSDSKYVVIGADRWIKKWSRNGWRTQSGDPVKNVDLWLKLASLMTLHSIKWQWVKGHAGIPLNERCDKLAVAMSKQAEAKQKMRQHRHE